MATERYAIWARADDYGWALWTEAEDLATASEERTPLLNAHVDHYVWDRHARIQLAHWGRE